MTATLEDRPLAQPIDRKILATLQAQAALLGVVLTEVEGDDGAPVYVISRWAYTRQCSSIDEVRDRLRRMGASA